MKRDIHLQATFPHPPDRVWRALTEPKAMAEWLMANDFEPKVGHRFRFTAKPQPGWDGTVDCEVTEVVPLRRLSYSWSNGKNKMSTQVTWTLEAVDGGTRLTLDHKGFDGLGAIMVSFMLQSGWKGMFRTRMPKVLEALAAGREVVGAGVACHTDAEPAEG